MSNYKNRKIPHLGIVEFKERVTLDEVSEALKQAEKVAENKKGTIFTNHLLSSVMHRPTKSPSEVGRLPEDTIISIIDVAVDLLDVRKYYDE